MLANHAPVVAFVPKPAPVMTWHRSTVPPRDGMVLAAPPSVPNTQSRMTLPAQPLALPLFWNCPLIVSRCRMLFVQSDPNQFIADRPLPSSRQLSKSVRSRS